MTGRSLRRRDGGSGGGGGAANEVQQDGADTQKRCQSLHPAPEDRGVKLKGFGLKQLDNIPVPPDFFTNRTPACFQAGFCPSAHMLQIYAPVALPCPRRANLDFTSLGAFSLLHVAFSWLRAAFCSPERDR